MTQVFAPILTFMVFSLLARNGNGTTLDTARVFTSLSLFALLAEPLSSLIMALVTFTASVGCFTRIQEFLVREARVESRKLPLEVYAEQQAAASKGSSMDEKSSFGSTTTKLGPSSEVSLKEGGYPVTGGDAITIQDGSFGWDPEKDPLLKNISVNIPRHKFTMLVGPVGCGKSTLLKAILGEVPSMGGSVQLASTKIAFCDQTAWHMNDTIQQSILGASDFDEKWYNTVVQACALDQDFQQLSSKDETIIGSKGIALSGGQSQRIVSFQLTVT